MNINLILFFVGFALAITALILMLIKIMKGKKVGVIAPIILILGIFSGAIGVWKEVQQRNNSNITANNTVKANKASNGNLASTKSNDNNKASQNNNSTFDANGSVVPKITANNDGYKVVTDADGSRTVMFPDSEKTYFNISPEGIRFFLALKEMAVVQIPQNESNSEGKIYKHYDFERDSTQISMLESKDIVPDELEEEYKKMPSSDDKEEEYDINTYNDMKPIDFVYKILPEVKTPKNTIENNFLSGTYVAKKDNILNTDTVMSIKIVDDNFLELQCNYIHDMNANFGYKLEELGKNAYKLYLYAAQFDSNGKEVTVSDKPVKRTFIIYRKSKDSFDIVFIDDNISRVSLNMNKE